uniref:uncharacterized protein LOC122593713 n=1 Tax=Erigeron canadensis TaxID=72917 RepID=UPI001CB96277|nr:uncharacterized protein LOC122593713 [Erigeron canadensis]
MIITSDCTERVLDSSIQDVQIKKKTVDSAMDSVISLMREVERVEKAAEQANEEASRRCSDIISKVHELQEAQQQVKMTNEMLVREAYGQKEILATKMEVFELQVQTSLETGDTSLALLDEMRTFLEQRLTSAIMIRELANKRKEESEAALAYEEFQMKTVEEESKRLNQEAVRISKLQEFLMGRGHVVSMLLGEISDKCQHVKLLKEELDQAILPDGTSQTSLILASTNPSLRSPVIPGQPQPEQANSDLPNKTSSCLGLGGITDDHVPSDKGEQIKFGESRSLISKKAVLNACDIKSCDLGKNLGNAATRKAKKLQENQTLATRIKKVKIKCKLQGNGMFAKSNKKVKVIKKLQESQMSKTDNKVKIKGKLHGNRKSTKRIKKLKIKSKLCGNQVSANSIKKVKIRGKLYGNHFSYNNIKNVNVEGNPHGN